MRLAIASGKGGTGKTTVATNLAWIAARDEFSVAYLDCDVEEPNGHLFLKPRIGSSRPVGRLHPQVDQSRCTHCGLCGEICQYSAIVCVGEKVLVYPELCHACGGCVLVCRPGAITEVVHETGRLEAGLAGPVQFVHGLLNIGEAMSAPLVRQVKDAARVVGRESFSGGRRARIRPGHCTACGKCEELCRFDAILFDGPGNGAVDKTFRVDPVACEGCGVCAWFCAEGAIEFGPVVNGEWFISETRCGPMVHAKLGIGGENSGKLVSTVRTSARRIAEQHDLGLVLIDGSPGIGCPVIASVTGATLVLAVTEPTLSGLHDLERVAGLTRHFGIPTLVCVNKWDLNSEVCEQIEARALEMGLGLAGRVRYDHEVTAAQIRGQALVESQREGCAAEIRAVWAGVETALKTATSGPWEELP